MAANWARRPIVLSIHSLKPRASRLTRFTLAHADRVLFNSQYTLAQAREKGYFPCRANVVYQGFDDRLFGQLPRSGEARATLNIPHDATLVVALGRLIEVKGIHILAGAADDLLATRPEAHLVIAGDGPLRPQIQEIVSRAACRDRIHLPGALPRGQVAQLLADADLFVNPGIVDSTGRAEGLGITTIEAMASGLPCVGSRVGGIAETIIDGTTGFLVAPGDQSELVRAIARLNDDAELRKQMGAAAKKLAGERFTWPVLAKQVMQVYTGL
jgi:glycosyltransferase involved in cell wall biosynthesis